MMVGLSLRREVADRDVRPGPLDGAAAADGRAGRRQRVRSSASASASSRSWSTRRKLDAEGVTLEHVVETTGNALWFSPLTFLEASTPGTGGFIDTPQQRLGIQHILPIQHAEDLAQVAIDPRTAAGRSADARRRRRPWSRTTSRSSATRLVGEGTGLLLVIEKFPDANTLDVTRDVEAALDGPAAGPPRHRRRHDRLPPGDVHRRVDRQRVAGAADRRSC